MVGVWPYAVTGSAIFNDLLAVNVLVYFEEFKFFSAGGFLWLSIALKSFVDGERAKVESARLRESKLLSLDYIVLTACY